MFSDDDYIKLNKMMEQYSDKSEDEIMNELIDTINSQSQNGTFNKASFYELCQMIDPMLSNTQREKIKQILEALNQ